MDLKAYYLNIRDIEATITEKFVIVVSTSKDPGGKAGVMTEVTRYEAARLIVEGRARLATGEETADFKAEAEAQRRIAEESVRASRPNYIYDLRTLASLLEKKD